MGVAGHLRIAVDEYDDRIRTFVPGYDEMILGAARALRLVTTRSPTVVDLGIGTGALSAACMSVRPDAMLIGLDIDEEMLAVARARLSGLPDVQLSAMDFLEAPLPACDAFTACLSLHHIRTASAKQEFYARCREAIRPSGMLVSADCFPGADARVAAVHREAWLTHLQATYTRSEAETHLAAWALEDVYFPLADELEWLRDAGFHAEVLWRQQGFAVIAAFAAAR